MFFLISSYLSHLPVRSCSMDCFCLYFSRTKYVTKQRCTPTHENRNFVLALISNSLIRLPSFQIAIMKSEIAHQKYVMCHKLDGCTLNPYKPQFSESKVSGQTDQRVRNESQNKIVIFTSWGTLSTVAWEIGSYMYS